MSGKTALVVLAVTAVTAATAGTAHASSIVFVRGGAYFGGIKGDLAFSGSYSASSPRFFELSGYEGKIPARISFSDDGRSVFVDGNHPALAGRGYNTVRGITYDDDRSTGAPRGA